VKLPRTVITYGVSLLTILAAVLLRLLLDPLLGDHFAFITLFPAIAFVAWHGGRGPALLALIGGALAAAYILLDARHGEPLAWSEFAVGLLLYTLVAFASIVMFESLRKAWKRTDEKRELLQTIFASIGDGVITTDTDGRITRMNAMAESLTGWKVNDAIGQPLDAVFRIRNEQTHELVENPVMRVLREGVVVGLANHTLLIAQDGTERPIDDSAAPIRDANGRVFGVVLTFRDLSRQQQEAKRFWLMADAAPVLMWMSGTDKLRTWFNKPWLTFVGRAKEQEVGTGWTENVHPDDLDRCLSTYGAAFDARQSFTMEYRLKRQDGEYRWLLDSGVPHHGPAGEFIGYIGSCTDITSHRQAEAAIQSAMQQLQIVTDSMSAPVVRCSRDLRFVWVSQSYAEWFGRRTQEIVGHTLIEVLGEPAFARLLPHFQQVLAGERVAYEEEVNLRGLGPRWVNAVYTPTRDQVGAVDGWVAVIIDTTEHKRMEKALKDADRRKDEFLATLAHELRNPLAPISNSLELMKLAHGNADLMEQARATMERQMGQMVRLIDDLLDVSRITRDKLELKAGRVELASVVHHAVEACGPVCAQAAHDLRVTLPPEPIYLNADPMRLCQVLGNLLNNSCKYTKPGGRIWLNAERQGSDVVITVGDNGIGIPPDKLPHVFELFTRVDQSLERSVGGLGIGLSLVKRIVAMHGGTVTAHSEGLGRGSEFIVRLPMLIEQPRAQPLPSSTDTPAPTTGRRILVVDDNRDSARSLALLLRLQGNETHTAHDGVEAVEKADALRPDVILLDIGLPKMNGYEACHSIREQPWGRDIVLLALTGWGQHEDRQKSVDAGFNGHLVKPVNHADLTKLLATYLGAEQLQHSDS
jgi:PAS domain S-box-containing protein